VATNGVAALDRALFDYVPGLLLAEQVGGCRPVGPELEAQYA
jgi:hypothetical protein